MPTRQTINPMALKHFPHTIILSEVYQMEGFSNWIKIEGMGSNYFCSCNLEQLKMSLKKSGIGTYTHTHVHTHTHVYTNFLEKSNVNYW